MESLKWAEDREKRRNEALEKHARLHKLFLEDRLSFERERRRAIQELIEGVQDEEMKQSLLELQNNWDKKMKGAGSAHNRFILAQAFFWEHFHEVWHPAIKEFNLVLNGK